MAKTWDTMTTEEHVASNEVTGAREDMEAAQKVYAETFERWQRECKADGVDPEIEREYYAIDKYKARWDAAIARFDAAMSEAVAMGVR